MEMKRREFMKDGLATLGFLAHPALSRFARGMRRKEARRRRPACQQFGNKGENNWNYMEGLRI
jgi:hypothetical protein